jgi:hypothetical protein
MTPETTRRVDALSEEIADLTDDLEILVDEGDTDDGAFAKHRLGELQAEYDALVGALADAERLEVQRALGLKLEKLKGLASRLKY